MINLKDALTSSIGKKILNGLTAIGLVLFIIGHLGGNLTLMVSPEAFNSYAEKLHGLGFLLYIVEFGLLAIIVVHAVTGISAAIQNAGARSQGYRSSQSSKGGPSNYGISSLNMIISGLVLLMFLVIHLIQFRLRPYWDAKYSSEDYYKHLYEMVHTAFTDTMPLFGFDFPVWVFVYCGTMVFLGFHLRHGIWSMFQSIGAMNARWKATMTTVALVLGVLIAVGFFFLPIGIYLEWIPYAAQ